MAGHVTFYIRRCRTVEAALAKAESLGADRRLIGPWPCRSLDTRASSRQFTDPEAAPDRRRPKTTPQG